MTAAFGITQADWFRRLKDRRPDRAHFWLPTATRPRRLKEGDLWILREAGGTRVLGYGRVTAYEVTTPAQLLHDHGDATGYDAVGDLVSGVASAATGERAFGPGTKIGNLILSDVVILDQPVEPAVRLRAFAGSFAYLTAEDAEAVLRGLPRPPRQPQRVDLPPDTPPERREYFHEVFVRDRQHVRELKDLYKGRCQLTGEPPIGGLAGDITEAHHIHWLTHGGPDNKDNLVILSPDMHRAVHAAKAEFNWSDLSFTINGQRVALRLNKHLKPRG